MNTKSKFCKFGAPPSRSRPLATLDDFVSGALRPVIGSEDVDTISGVGTQAEKLPSVSHVLPWNHLDDQRRRELFNLRFTDAEKAMLKYLEKNGRDSMHAICIDILRPELLRRIAALTGTRELPSTSSKKR